jgi:1,4-alpha-glucan branching enzyme
MSSFAIHPLDPNEIAALLHASHSDPFRVLGPHRAGDDLVIRVFRPEARELKSWRRATRREFSSRAPAYRRLYQATIPGESRAFSYFVKVIA